MDLSLKAQPARPGMDDTNIGLQTQVLLMLFSVMGQVFPRSNGALYE